jgi:hypothetical protein
MFYGFLPYVNEVLLSPLIKQLRVTKKEGNAMHKLAKLGVVAALSLTLAISQVVPSVSARSVNDAHHAAPTTSTTATQPLNWQWGSRGRWGWGSGWGGGWGWGSWGWDGCGCDWDC